MKEAEVKQRIKTFLTATSRWVVIPGALAVALGINCGDNTKYGCPSVQADCNGTCVYLATDEHNCGECGVKCADGEVCVDSKCELKQP